jgi:hypothetical protein
MIPVTQTRTGKTGNCFAASLASVLGLPLKQVPDFKKANEDPEVNVWLAKRGLRYREVPATQSPPKGWHIICGVSPRGGYHAIVGFDGLEEWDPHPIDGSRHGLDKTIAWGVLEPLDKGKVKDMDIRKGVTKCQECGDNLLGDDVAEVHGKVVCPECADSYHKATDVDELSSHQAVQFMLEAVKAANSGNTKKALERATLAEFKAQDARDKALKDKAQQVIEKLKGTARGTARDADTRTFAEQLSATRNAIQYIKMSLKTEKNAKQKAAYEKQLTEYTAKERDLARKVEAQNESEAWHEKASSKYFPSGFKGRSRVFDAAIDRYSMAQILNALGIDIKAYMGRNETQKRELLKTAIAKLKGAK